MNVKNLIEVLNQYPDELSIMISSDEEGNSFRDLLNGWIGTAKFFGNEIVAVEDAHEYEEDELEEKLVLG